MEYNVDNADAKITFIDVVLGFMQMKNADVYVTGSNSKMLSYDILTQFRDRGGEIRVYPLPFAEFYNEYKGDKRGRIIILMVVCRLLLHFNLREKLFEPYGKRKWERMIVNGNKKYFDQRYYQRRATPWMHFMSHISTAKRNCWKSMRNTGAIPVPLGRW